MNEFVLNGMFLKFFALPWKFIFSLLTLKLYLLQWKIHPFPHILTSIISPMRKSRRGVKQWKTTGLAQILDFELLTPEPSWQIGFVTFCIILYHYFHHSGHSSSSLSISGRRKRRRKKVSVFVSGQSLAFPLAKSKLIETRSCHRFPQNTPGVSLAGPIQVLRLFPFRRREGNFPWCIFRFTVVPPTCWCPHSITHMQFPF